MIDWIKSLFCKHEWRCAHSVQEMDYNFRGERVVVGAYDVYVCQKCLKKKKISY